MSSDLWNRLDLNQPPNFTCKIATAKLDLKTFSNTCRNALHTLQHQEILHLEAAMLSRLIYRMKTVFRADKGLKAMEKINHCLRHYLSLNLVAVYENLCQSMPSNFKSPEVYCPTLQMLEYVLVRTQGLSALLCRTVHTCFEAAHFLKSRINVGHNWGIAITSLSVISRIWSLSLHLLKCTSNWYSILLRYRDVLNLRGAPWLPDGYVFPKDLRTWLSIPCLSPPELDFSGNKDGGPTSSTHTNISVQPSVLGSGQDSSSASTVATFDEVGEGVSRSSFADHQESQLTDFFTNTTCTQDSDARDNQDLFFGSVARKGGILKEEKFIINTQAANCNVHHAVPSHENQYNVIKKTTDMKTEEHVRKKKRQKTKETASPLPRKDVSGMVPKNVNTLNDNGVSLQRCTFNFEKMSKSPGKIEGIRCDSVKVKKRSKVIDSGIQSISRADSLDNILTSLHSANSILKFLDKEAKQRSFSAMLGFNEWSVLNLWLRKQHAKLQRTDDPDKKTHLLDKIKKMVKATLS